MKKTNKILDWFRLQIVLAANDWLSSNLVTGLVCAICFAYLIFAALK